ncbi:alpha/beta hydrolase [Caldicellulosiruptoraceae bacterium PP1]
MAFIECSFLSESLMMHTQITVFVPTKTFGDIYGGNQNYYNREKKLKTLYLLHGASDDHTMWMRRTNIERYAEEKNIAVVMPSAALSFYTDMAYGQKYFTYISEELPQVVRYLFPLSDKREDNFIAGLSMGGYGAFKIALRKPESFCAAGSFSGAVNLAEEVVNRGSIPFEAVFGDLTKVKGSENDLCYLLQKLKENNAEIPKLYQSCGTEDFLYEGNVKFKNFAKELGVDITYIEEPGTHEWGFWDRHIKKFLDWIFEQSK